jgi:glycerol-3-phosphate dehydrogenase (NAD(P)+)
MATVAIVGAGFMGSAMAWPLADNGHSVRLVGTPLDAEIIRQCRAEGAHPRLRRPLPAGVRPCFAEELGEALAGADIVVSGVNSRGVRWLGSALAPHLRPTQLLLAITKGLEVGADGALVILPDVLAAELPASLREPLGMAAVGGPCIAGELAGRRDTRVIFGARDLGVAERLAAACRTPYYRVTTTADLVALEVCAALKNAYAVAVGVASGLLERRGGPDAAGAQLHNAAAAMFGQACAEMRRLLEALGLTAAFAAGLPGAGDLYVTCQGGRTVRLGRLLGLGHPPEEARAALRGETLEGLEIVAVMARALPALAARGRLGAEELPLLRGLIGLIAEGRSADWFLATSLAA